MIKDELLKILACPKCKNRVVLDKDGKFLICESCAVRYPINEQGIPIMLIDRAEKI